MFEKSSSQRFTSPSSPLPNLGGLLYLLSTLPLDIDFSSGMAYHTLGFVHHFMNDHLNHAISGLRNVSPIFPIFDFFLT